MAKFSFKLKHKIILTKLYERKVVKSNVIVKGLEGVITEYCDSSTGGTIYVVLADNRVYKIHPKSFDNSKKKKLYVKDDNDKWIEVIRNSIEDRHVMPDNYLPFKPKMKCCGNVVEKDNTQYFVIKTCWKDNDNKSYNEAMKELNES